MSTMTPEEQRALTQYQQFSSIWREIDDGRTLSLQDNQDLPLLINDKQRGVTPLFLAIQRKQVDIVLLLLANGADPNIICKDASPLWAVCYHGLTELVYPLLDNGADPNCLCSGAAPLHVAAARGLLEIVEIICSFPHGVNVNVCSERLGTPLHVAISRGHQFVLDELLKWNPDLSLRNRSGQTPLHVACCLPTDTITLKLLNSKLPIDPFIKDEIHGSTVAHRLESARLFRLLLRTWPQLLHVSDNYGRTPTYYMPQEALSLFTSISSKVAEQSGEHLLAEVQRYGDLNLVCPVFTSQLSPPTSTSEEPILIENGSSATPHIDSLAQTLKDTSITIPTERVLCHKAVLYARSDYFKDLLQEGATDFQPSPTSSAATPTELPVPSISADIMRAIVHYLYTDTLKCKRELLDGLIVAATTLRLQRLVELAQAKLGQPVEPSVGTLSNDLLTLFTEGYFADVQIHLPSKNTDRSYRLHRFVLAAFSEYFRTMFSVGLLESRTGVVQLHALDEATFEAYLHWLYSFRLKPSLRTLRQCFALLELSASFISPDLSIPIQTKILTMLVDSEWANLDVAIAESDRLSAQIVYEQCAVYVASRPKTKLALAPKLPLDVRERLEMMAAPNVDEPTRTHSLVPTSRSRQAHIASLSTR